MNYDKSEIVNTINDLDALQKETESLLKALEISSGPKKSKKAPSAATKQLKTIVSNAKSGKSHQQHQQQDQAPKEKRKMVSTSLDLEKTQKLYGQNTPARITVEVFDDAPSDLTPRFDTSKSLDAGNAKLRQIFTSEQKFRKLGFEEETSRVKSRGDVFVPAPGVTVSQINMERQRLAALEETARMQLSTRELMAGERKVYLEKDKAALKFQAAFRGHIGRQKARLVRRLREVNGTGDEQPRVGDWIEVKNRESGEIWYYDTRTGESQWSKPSGLHDMLPKGKALKNIPSGITDLRRTASAVSLNKSSPLAKTKGASFRTAEELKQIEDNMAATKECYDIMGLSAVTAVDNLTAPDGSFRPQLRKTVLDAILTTRFDSVSTVLADDRWTEKETAPFSKTKGVNQFESSGKVDSSRKQMSAAVVIHKKKKNPNQLVTDPNADDKEAITPTNIDKKELTVSDIAYPGFDALSGEQQQTMCFGCWSAGIRRSCALHEDKEAKLKPSQTMLLCRNWDLGVMRRRYRSEEIQEIFMKRSSSLRFDGKRRKFLTVTEHRHAIYRSLYSQLGLFNFRMVLVTKARRWLHSLLDVVRSGQAKPAAAKIAARVMRARRTKVKGGQVRRYHRGIYRRLPIPPTTGYSYEERIGETQYLFKHQDLAAGGEVELIRDLPIPKPRKLYLPRVQSLPVPRSIPMPYPEYSEADANSIVPINEHLKVDNPAKWLEQLSAGIARASLAMSSQQVTALTPLPGLELIRRTKYPPTTSIKFATFGRKPTPGLLAVGGLSAELMVSQLVSTYIPAQYGNFMVMDKTTVSPGISPEITITFQSLQQPPVTQVYILRPLEHPLNYRRAPSITVCSLVEYDNKYYYGRNRPDQTGEQEPHGFRTTSWARYLLTHLETDPSVFTPSNEVVSLNSLSANRSKTTHVDLTYPFCEPSTKDNSSLEFYHLLLTGQFSSSKTQVFTALTVQEPGQFLSNAREDLPMGHLVVHVYRSWAFVQKDTIEQFMSDDGVPYWYHRRTGQTFWERPFYEEEKVMPLRGGTIIDLEHPEEPALLQRGYEGADRRYLQGEFRQHMLAKHESEGEAAIRRQRAQAAILVAKHKGLFPSLNESIEVHAAESDDGGSVNQVHVPDMMSRGTYGGDTAASANAKQTEKQQTAEISMSMSRYSEGPNSPTRPLPAGGSSPTHGGPVRGSNLDHDSMLIGATDSRQHLHGAATGHGMSSVQQFQATAPAFGVDENIMQQLSVSIGQMLSNMSLDATNPQDMIKMGVGMGMAMLSTNLASGILAANSVSGGGLGGVGGASIASGGTHHSVGGAGASHTSYDKGFFPAVAETDYVDGKPSKKVMVHDPADKPKHPIGIPDYRVQETTAVTLSHKEEVHQKKEMVKSAGVPLSALEQAMELKIVEVTDTPDEAAEKILVEELPKNADEKLKTDIPILIYPELSTHTKGGAPPNSVTHEVAGRGTAHVGPDEVADQEFVKGSNQKIRKAVMPLPVGFFAAITARHIGKQLVDYLPQIPNLPIARTVGRVKPRSTAVDWIAIGFDPWSAGRSPLGTEFIPSLATKASKLFKGGAARAEEQVEEMRKKTLKDAFITVEDSEGLVKDKVEVSKNQIMAEDFRKLCSLVRHAKFTDAEAMLNEADWNVPIDYQNETGNTILHIAAQNGSRRLVKLCLRRGAFLDIQNLNGQTALHFAYGYGYNELGEYLISKGASDDVLNKDGLTCYEGLGSRELELL